MEKQNKIQFFRSAIKIGGSIMVAIPPELCQYLEIEEGNTIGLTGDESKWGNFIGVWNEDKQKQKGAKK